MAKRRKTTQPVHDDILALTAGNTRDLLLAPLIDPYMVELEKIITKRRPATTEHPLLRLQILHRHALRNPGAVHSLDAEAAILLSGKVGLPSPTWALAKMKATREEKIQNQNVDLNQSLGFTAAGRGTTSEAERRARENIADQSRLRIWGLRLLGKTIQKACWMEAGRLQTIAGWNTTFYLLEHDLRSLQTDPDAREVELYTKRQRVAERLRQDFYTWRTESEKDPESEASRYYLEQLIQNRTSFLAQFPND